jgi:hypothetical protein
MPARHGSAPLRSDEGTERQCEALGIGTIETGAAKHHIATVLQEVRMDAMPEKFDSSFIAVGRKHAGTAELEELKIVMARDQRPMSNSPAV